MSELEFEKACRGPMKPVSNEFAWGTAEIATDRYEFVQGTAGTDKERLTPKTLSKTAGNAVYYRTRLDLGPLGEWTRADDQVGPLRAGIFETESGDRVASGASFWGIMELSGNLWERTVTVGNLYGRGIKGTTWGSFLGTHGNGSTGVPGDWPAAVGAGFRGGYWLHSAGALRVSDRVSAVAAGADRYAHYGFRCVRTAPK
jgi:formylglycine-generating enzyme required for sulfatase activity